MEFMIPQSKSDLFKRTNTNQYVMDSVIHPRQLAGALETFREDLKYRSPLAIIDNFDIPFSILHSQNDVSQSLLEETWKTLLKGFSNLNSSLERLLENSVLPSDARMQHLNAAKMFSYLLCQFVQLFEEQETKPSVNQGRKKKNSNAFLTMDWSTEREDGVRNLLQLIELSIHRLWEPPIVEDQFVSLITNCCYKLIENANATKNRETKNVISFILGTMVKRYNHALGASLSILQLLLHFEKSVGPLAYIVDVLVSQFGATNVVFEIMRGIGQLDPKHIAKDTSGTRAYATFMVELTQKIPSVILQNISVMLCHLNGESFVMRNTVLSIMGEILIRIFNNQELDKAQKKLRNEFLDHLEDHIHDVSAFVRIKSLQIWLQIVNEKCLPLARQEQLVSLILGRLHDKSCQVRKFAIQLITSLLKSNPFAAKLQIADLKENYEKEKEKLKDVMPEEREAICTSADDEEIEEGWKRVEINLKVVLEKMPEVIKNGLIEDEENNLEIILKKIFRLLEDEQYLEAVTLLLAAENAWPRLVICEETSDTDETSSTPFEIDLPGESLEFTRTIMKALKRIFFKEKREILKSSDGLAEDEHEDDGVVNNVTKQQVVVQYLKDCLTFACQIQMAVPVMAQLLGSKVVSDVLEAVEFFITSYEFGISISLTGIRKILVLIWSQEASVKNAVIAAYKRLYLNVSMGNQRSMPFEIVRNLTALMSQATLAELASLERLMIEFMKSGELEPVVVQTLWEKFTLKIPSSSEESRAALHLLAMIGGVEVEVIQSNIEVLVKEGLGERGEADLRLARYTCMVLLKLSAVKMVSKEPFRLPEDHSIFLQLGHILVSSLTDVKNIYWIPLAEKAVDVIFELSVHPEQVASQIFKSLARKMLDEVDKNAENQGGSLCPSGILARFLSFAGSIAHGLLLYLDLNVLGELKQCRAASEDRPSKNVHLTKESMLSKSSNITNDDELWLTGASADDEDAEFIRRICEQEIVTGDTLLASVQPLLMTVCMNQSKYSNPELRTAACLALAKFMLVSSKFCDDHLQLLFTILEKSHNPVCRANTIITLGDLVFRFPNLIEPWTPHLYARLKDDEPLVRKNTLQVLTHLILNDMVKVKGQMSELTMCIVDSNDQIVGLAKLLFFELSKKGNALYNIIPDTISCLSDPDKGVEEGSFRVVMQYLLSFIQKDKHSESLMEKLCHRYRATKTERQWRDLSYCLSLLSMNEKGLHKLQENFDCFSDKLSDEAVYESFCTLIKKVKNFSKPETKVLIEELQQRLDRCHGRIEDDDVAQRPTQTAKGKVPSTDIFKTPCQPAQRNSNRNTASRSATKRSGKSVRSSVKVPLRKQPTRRSRALRSSYFEGSDDSMDENEDSENEPPVSDDDDDFTFKPSRNLFGSNKTRGKVRQERINRPLGILNSP